MRYRSRMWNLKALLIVLGACISMFAALFAPTANAAPVNSNPSNSATSVGVDGAKQPDGRYGSIVVDSDTLEIVHARQIDAQRYPASLTKLMTLYLTFDALNSGQLTLDQKLSISRNAQNTPPSKLGLKQGQTITVDHAIQALAVKSANDVAVVLAEAIGGSEANFAEMMTARARTLGMLKTDFANPHGLPNPLQVTTARDMAKLAMAHLNNHRRYYHYFSQKNFRYKGKNYKNTNGLLHWLSGVDGFKTGYTRASGYNLVISAKRDGRRIIAVVLGGASNKSRNSHMKDLIERSFETLGVSPIESVAPISIATAESKTPSKRNIVTTPLPQKQPVKTASQITSKAVRLRGRGAQPITIVTQGSRGAVQSAELDSAWAIQVGAFETEADARAQLDGVSVMIGAGAHPKVTPINLKGRTLYRARFTGLNFEQAHSSCETLGQLKTGCAVISPGGR